MGIRKSTIGFGVSIVTSFVIVIFLILFWSPLSDMVAGMNVGIFMFANMEFWKFLAFFMGLVFIVTLIFRTTLNSRFGGKAR